MQVTAKDSAEVRLNSMEELEQLRGELQAAVDPDQTMIVVCHGTGCVANGSQDVTQALKNALAEAGEDIKVMPGIKTTGCHGFCSRGPLVIIKPANVFYQQVKPGDVEEIVAQTILKGETVDRLLYKHPQSGDALETTDEIPFYAGQERVVLQNIGQIDPTDLEDALRAGAYAGMAKALTAMQPAEVIESVTKAGLRGRGGAGFPTGVKWGLAAKHGDVEKFVLCNADEGDPGAFMDRSVMEGDPHAVVEGMIIGGYAIGANVGYVYVRAEYPLAIKHLEMALDDARALGLLGENILGSGFNFDIRINRGAGAFVCGEETALMRSVEGKVGEPVPRPPYPSDKGLFGKPSVLNNVETWANVSRILDRGWEWFAGLGTEKSKGTKVFALVGKVNNVGLVEVPMGIKLKEIVMEIGGGVPGSDHFKAVQTGGPSGGCLPWEDAELPVDFDSLIAAGSMMGSGGMIVMDDRDCMVDVAKYFLGFLEEESCGKCFPCRLGVPRLRETLNRFSKGQGTVEDIDDLYSLAEAIKMGSLCALGGTAPNAVLSTLRYFRGEYEAHILEHRCPAGVCKDLITYKIDPDTCTGCRACARACPQEAISGEKKKPHTIDESLCIRCGMCMESCKFGAIQVF
ncbi:MAG: NADH-quinone oxidoreductase subunit NuoF [Desulfarculaceae bacterium]|nr:NADH-quinone oxidoreductase subunit NuoF [Desulfarculaceae bacterium]MCF8073012.1 NADH-quinone oxidoreductase subunit NuoF [Desulfarculaceae bacterium]MCF8101903.1 NADH-quinone oxidoreductase subunit NuoF [Desulfarculaceae bacterium]MCF8115430.1 NADH-quinone oxidoreductase subunit NuoF [Desulfarculaceae bacterium]